MRDLKDVRAGQIATRIALLVVLAVLAAVLTVATPVRGQTPPGPPPNPANPTPTATATSTALTAQQILTRAENAVLAKGSAHVVVTVGIIATGSEGGAATETITGDLAWQPKLQGAFHATIAAPNSAASSSVLDLVITQKYLAAKQPGHAWSCVNLAKAVKAQKIPATAGVPTTSTGSVHVSKPVLVGADTIDGAAVWHLRSTVREKVQAQAKSKKTQTLRISIDLYVNQTDYTLPRVVETVGQKVQKTQVTVNETIDLTQYGETVHVTVPTACKGRLAVSLALPAPFNQASLARLLNPATLFGTLPRMGR